MIKSYFLMIFYFLFLPKSRNNVYDSKSISFRVLPWHLDPNLHVNNAYYLNYCNRARLVFLAETGALKWLVKLRLNPILIKNDISYKKELRLFQKFIIKTKIEAVEKKMITLRHEFISNDKLMTTCLSTAKIIGKKNIDVPTLLKEFSDGN
jgi:YbgC/YbaW family acyl-CoA thioester hydrolase